MSDSSSDLSGVGRPLGHHVPSPSSSSSRPSLDGGRNTVPSPLRKNKSILSRDTASVRKDTIRRSSSSPRRELQGRLESVTPPPCVRTVNPSSPFADGGGVRRPAAQPPVIYPELDRYQNLQQPGRSAGWHNIHVLHRLATHDLSPPTPASILFSGNSSQVSASPSTRLSESPGPGPYSRDTTPTSTSSQSPILAVPSRSIVASRDQQNGSASTRPHVTWRGPGSIPREADATTGAGQHGLAPVRESMTSSSSSSTVRDGDKNVKREKRPDRQPSPLSTSPIPGNSSQDSPKRKVSEALPLIAPREKHNPSSASRSLPRPETASPSKTPSSPRAGPPPRPSRDGTPDMPSQFFKITPIIQSNLSSLPKPFERRVSEPVTSRSLPVSTTSLHQARRNASTPQLPVIRQTSSKTASPVVLAEPKRVNSNESSRSNQALSKASSSFTTRFPFFGRKKTAPEGLKDDKGEYSPQRRPGRKGPAAGTGHEGYGRFGAIRRRSSSGSSVSRGLAEPQLSESSYPGSDSFFADRVQPVVIAGGEIVENRNANADFASLESEKPLTHRHPGAHHRAAPAQTCPPSKAQRTTLWPSPMSPDAPAPLSSSHTRGGSGMDGVMAKPTIAFRRSVQRLRLSADNPLRLPQPIITDTPASASSPMTSIDASIVSEDYRLQLRKESSRGSNDSYLSVKNPQRRAPSSRKWNLFGRSHSRPNTKGDGEEVQATVVAVDKKRVAFYAMMDSTEHGHVGPTNFVEGLLEHLPLDMAQHTTITRSQPSSCVPRDVFGEADRPATRSQTGQAPWPMPSSGKRGRLAQVGRIPHVVSRRPENPSPQTFSRPFRNSLQASPRVTFDVYDPDSIATGPTPPKPSTPVLDGTAEEPAADSEVNSSSYGDSTSKLSSEVARGEQEFLAFSPRELEARTIDTSSSDSRDICILADATAVVPKVHDPPDEDEIWDEYNDLLDEDSGRMFLTPMPLEVSPLRLKRQRSRSIKGASVQSAAVPGDCRKVSTYSKAPSHSTSGSADMTERIRRAFQPRPNQTVAEGEAGAEPSLGKQWQDALPANVHHSVSNRNSSGSGKTIFTDCSAVSSDEESPLAQVNLRVGSMTVSKWLSFGHVLFSDIRHELDLAKDPAKGLSILVIDGLGNDDWSFYAAETYPAASLYNLSPRAALPAEMRTCPSSFPLSPPNHHQVQYTCHLDKFPFAAHSFDGLVYRFPVAAPESHYRNIVNEARRVLRPGGYIELSVLDADLNSMGNRGRRTVRRLKERVHEEAAEINLASTADLMLRLLGKAGFSSIRAARVGVPVASSITRSNMNRAERKDKSRSSLADMMRDKSPMADEGITKLVARVGRWWYTRCYESATSAETDKSIWANKALLSECEELGTSLKLMVCCARAPHRAPSF